MEIVRLYKPSYCEFCDLTYSMVTGTTGMAQINDEIVQFLFLLALMKPDSSSEAREPTKPSPQ